jgi:hypothetical protein
MQSIFEEKLKEILNDRDYLVETLKKKEEEFASAK